MPVLKNEEKTYAVGPQASNKKALTSESPKSVESPRPGATKDVFSLEKWRRDFDEYAKHSLQEQDKQLKATKEITRRLLAKMQAMQEMGEIWQQVDKRLKDGEGDRCRGLSREQQKEVLAEIYNDELVAKMQQDVLNKNKMEADWEEHRLRRIELIQWSKLPEKEKWLEFYNKPNPNLSKGENYASQAQEHPEWRSPQTNQQQEKNDP